MKKKNTFRVIRIRDEDYKKIKKWAAIRDMKMYEVVRNLIEKV